MKRKNDDDGYNIDFEDSPVFKLVVLLIIACIIGLFVVYAVRSDSIQNRPYPKSACAVFETITTENVTEQWFIHWREYPDTERSQTAHSRFRNFVFLSKTYYYDGIAFKFGFPHPSLDKYYLTYLLYAGWYYGDDGYPHPSCGVWMIDKTVAKNLLDSFRTD